jgi:Holliday junction resolvase RusA-like endonuclease
MKSFHHPHTKQIVTVHQSKGLKAWERAVKKAAKKAHKDGKPSKSPFQLSCKFMLPKPKTSKRVFPTVRPDLDKLVRAIADALTGVFWDDDSQVTGLSAAKFYVAPGEEGVAVSVAALSAEAPTRRRRRHRPMSRDTMLGISPAVYAITPHDPDYAPSAQAAALVIHTQTCNPEEQGFGKGEDQRSC